MPGVDDLNENKIVSIHYFLYPENNFNVKTSMPVYTGKKLGLSTKDSCSIQVNLTGPELNDVVFPRPYGTCNVYAIANLPDALIKNPESMTIQALREIALSADFTKAKQDYFVMEGLGEAEIVNRKSAMSATGRVQMDRVASKISLNFDIEESVEINDVTYYSSPESITVEFVNGVSNAVVGASPVAAPNYYSSGNRTVKANGEFYSCDSFYTYPSAWEIGDQDEPYLRVTMKWYTITTSVDSNNPSYNYVDCYYKVILTGEEFKRNTWYDLTVGLSVLGSFEPEAEKPIEVKEIVYKVTDWTDGLEIESEIHGARYLIVDKERYDLYNQDEVRIPFFTSHTCEIVDDPDADDPNLNQAMVTYPDYSKEIPDEDAPYTWNSNSWSLRIVGKNIVFSHALRNDLSAGKGNYDTAPYTITFRVRHEGEYDDVYFRDITIVQYPAMSIECHPNRDLDGGYAGNYQNTYYKDGGVCVNGGKGSSANYGGIYGLAGQNKNPNMYVIKTSVLPADSEYVLGDPRSLDVNNLGNNSWTEAKGIESLSGANRKLLNYYPTLTTDDARDVIAPKFRVASSYGVTGSISYTNAQYRCASYQEDGYPAGRWRLPTQSEIAFIVQLSAQQVIPELFTAGNAYWCAGGRVTPNSNGSVTISESTGNNNTTSPVRCVYDEWYWEKSAYPRMPENNVTFTWGDAAR